MTTVALLAGIVLGMGVIVLCALLFASCPLECRTCSRYDSYPACRPGCQDPPAEPPKSNRRHLKVLP